MPADASPRMTRRSLLGMPEDPPGHISSLVVRAHPARLDAVIARIQRLSIAEVALSDPPPARSSSPWRPATRTRSSPPWPPCNA